MGCTLQEDPDGHQGKEWCRLANPKPGEKDWDYCIEDEDYDQVRYEISSFYEADFKIIKYGFDLAKLP